MKINELLTEAVKQRLDAKCWKGKHKEGTKIKGGVRVNNCVPNESIEEESKGLYYNVNKRKKAGTSRDASSPKAPTAQAWKDAAKTAKKEGVAEARSNPERNRRSGSGKYDLINYAEDNIRDIDNWAVSMTMEPKLGINPQAAVSEDTPKGIYFYPLQYFMKMADRDESLPWGDNFPYIQLFQYDRSGEMTQQTKVDPAKLKQVLLQYCPEEIIQQAIDEPEYDGTPYWFIYDCLSRLGKGDETNVIRWNKVLRDLGFTSVYDPGHGWIAYNEPTQGVVLDPRIIKQHKMFSNRNPTLQNRRYDIQGLADAIGWSSYFQRESQLQRIYNHPDEKKVMLDVAKSMLKPFLGKSSEEADEMGYDKAIKAAADKVIEILKNTKNVDEGINELARVLELSGLNLTADEQFDIIEEMVEQLAQEHGVDPEVIWEDFESVEDDELLESAAWRRSAGKSKKGGLNAKGVASYRRENPGSKLQMAVTTKPSKLKKGSKAAKRRKSFCARMGGVKGPMKKPNGKPTRKALALRKWNC